MVSYCCFLCEKPFNESKIILVSNKGEYVIHMMPLCLNCYKKKELWKE